MRRTVRPEDLVTVAFSLIMALLTAAKRERIDGWQVKVTIDLLVAVAALAIPYVHGRMGRGATRIARDWYPVGAVAVAFFNLRGVVAGINPRDYDLQLAAIDRWLFGGINPTQWMERFSRPWLDEYLQLAYVSYYFIPLVLGLVLYRWADEPPGESFRRAVLVLLLTFYLSYLGYLLVPAVGPRFTMPHSKELNGLLLTPYLKRLINLLEPTHRDCFPSGHTAVSFAAFLLAFRHKRRLFWWLLPVVLSLIVSTVYHRYHYAVDVLAGMVLGLFAFLFGEWLFDHWESRWE